MVHPSSRHHGDAFVATDGWNIMQSSQTQGVRSFTNSDHELVRPDSLHGSMCWEQVPVTGRQPRFVHRFGQGTTKSYAHPNYFEALHDDDIVSSDFVSDDTFFLEQAHPARKQFSRERSLVHSLSGGPRRTHSSKKCPGYVQTS
jgi:hypothetical protein